MLRSLWPARTFSDRWFIGEPIELKYRKDNADRHQSKYTDCAYQYQFRAHDPDPLIDISLK
jgi:hypothetical protein